MSTESPHWFSNIDPDETLTTHRWQPCLETYAGHVPSIPLWFATESDCDEWIAANLATPHDIAHAVDSERAAWEKAIAEVDKSPAVTWAGHGGAREVLRASIAQAWASESPTQQTGR